MAHGRVLHFVFCVPALLSTLLLVTPFTAIYVLAIWGNNYHIKMWCTRDSPTCF